MRLTIEWSRVRILLRPFGNFGNFLYPTLPVSFGRDTKSRWSLLSGVYARGSKRPHQSALEMCNCRGLSNSPPPPPPPCNKPHTLRDAVTGRNRKCYMFTHRPLSRRLDRCDRVIQNESRDPFGGNVYYVTMQITLNSGMGNVICIVT